ncbi:class I SAM-dependent methyltransferase [Glycomyces sp. L485]|uniref:class I SAM-dependent methyltransferase n=1 Tax=Glycomyces sp. L485 TaxID=2909235 RepID=UPI001F4B0065|nr:class I SAM-dependent methyltransferase [Glycomyces sp. L485]MCH7231037.1 class I SAM-dependent methyltransferase [Glycomyces sp. L485]
MPSSMTSQAHFSSSRPIISIGCHDGWSTAWLLRALRDNGGGRLHSFDRSGRARGNIPDALAESRWSLTTGDARAAVGEMPRRIDYLFLDGSPSARFAKWYLPNLVAPLVSGTPVSFRNVFRHRVPLPLSGASLILKWLRHNHMDYFTAARARQPVIHRQLNRVRWALGFNDPVHTGDHDPMIFFQAALRGFRR